MSYTQSELFTPAPEQAEIERLRQQLQSTQAENEALRQQLEHAHIARETLGSSWRGGLGTFDYHAVRKDGLYIFAWVEGSKVTVFVPADQAIGMGWMDKEGE